MGRDAPRPCLKVRQHRERLARLRKHGKSMGIVFDHRKADQAVAFFARNLRHWKEPHAGKPFALADWQADDIVRPLWGFRWADSGLRVFREAYIQLPRKNGKSALSAGLLLLMLYTDGEGLELYTAATKRDQANIVFRDCKQFALKSPILAKRTRVLMNEIVVKGTESFLRPLSADYNSMDGLNISAVSIDELHAHRTPDLHDVLVTATGSRSQPLALKITTAGETLTSVCKDQYDYSAKVLSGAIDDPTFFAYIAEADEDLDWESDEALVQANPNLGVSVRLDYLRAQRKKALEIPSYRRTFEKYHLNRWVASGSAAWLDASRWQQLAGGWRRADLAGQRCFGGLDLASNRDIAAFVLLFPGSPHRVLAHYWVPEETLLERSRVDGVPYDAWQREGWLTATPGDVIDLDRIAEQVIDLSREYRIARIAYDTWGAQAVSQRLMAEGLELVPFIQGLRSFHAPSMELERLVLAGGIEHDGNAATTWMVSNCRVLRDASDKIRPVKEHKNSRLRIDGVVAAIMALDCAMRDGPEPMDLRTLPDDLRSLLGA